MLIVLASADALTYYGAVVVIMGTVVLILGFLVGSESWADDMNKLGAAAVGLGTTLAFGSSLAYPKEHLIPAAPITAAAILALGIVGLLVKRSR